MKILPITAITALTVLPLSLTANIITIDAIADTFVRSDETGPQGQNTFLLPGGHSAVGPLNTFLRFDLSSVDLGGATVESVTLRLTSIAQAGAGTININLYQLGAGNADWREGTFGVDGTGAHFNTKLNIAVPTPWAGGNTNANFVAGVDYYDTVLGNYTGATNTGDGGQFFDFGNAGLATLFDASIGGQLNLILMDQTGGTNFLRIASRENGTFAGPQLIVVVPEPSTYAAVLGALVLGFILVRRRLRR